MYYDNYLLSTVAPEIKRTSAPGLHRYHRGMTALDLDQSSSPSPDAQLSFRWNGLWTGVRPTQVLTALISGEQRGFVFSFDSDNKNRLYEVTQEQENDYNENGTVPIESFFTTGRYSFQGTGATNRFLRKRISGGEMWLSEIKGQATTSTEYRSDSNPCWYDLMEPSTFGCNPCQPQAVDCIPQRGGNLFKRYKFNTPDPKDCSNISEIPAIEGSEFQLKVNISGSATIDRLRIMANIKNNEDSPVGDCPENNEECPPFLCCQERYWDYSINQS
jgi:hypothetical protein